VADSVPVTDVLTAQARRARKVAWVIAPITFVVIAAIAFTLRGKTDSGKSVFHVEDQIAMTVLGLLAAVAVLWFTRPRVVATVDGLRVRNLLGWIDIPWNLVSAVRFDRGSPWASLELVDDDLIAMMAVQANDKQYAIDTVRALRAMLADYRTRTAAPAE
jgi:Bacterial PH domain